MTIGGRLCEILSITYQEIQCVVPPMVSRLKHDIMQKVCERNKLEVSMLHMFHLNRNNANIVIIEMA